MIDGATNTVTQTITVGSGPFSIAVNPGTNTVYVTNSNSNTVSVINGATNAVTATVAVGSHPQAIAVNPATNTIYVANYSGVSVSVMNGSTNAVTSTVGVGAGAIGIGINPVIQHGLCRQFHRRHGVGDQRVDRNGDDRASPWGRAVECSHQSGDEHSICSEQ